MTNLIVQLGRKEAFFEEDVMLVLANQSSTRSFILPVMEYARSSGLILSIVESKLHIKMKTVKYSWQDKVK
jgi:hypothetical protein